MGKSQYEQQAETIVLTEDGMHIMAYWSRILCGCGTEGRFEPIFVMENIIPAYDDSFNYRIVEREEWMWNSCEAAFYFPATNEIVIRSDVYEGALHGEPMDVITIAHEVSHYIQNLVMRFLSAIKCVDFKTVYCRMGSKEMERHELQTDKITSLVLCPENLVQGRTEEEVTYQFVINPLIQLLCGCIKKAARHLIESLTEKKTMKEVEKCAV